MKYLVIVFIFSLLSTNLLAQNYIISQDGSGDFTGFSDAILYLYTEGIDQAVSIQVLPGIYYEQLLFNGIIPGASATNTITFIGSEDNSQDTALQFVPTSSEERYVIRFIGTSHLRFDNLTIEATDTANWGWPIHIMDNCQDIKIINCRIITSSLSITANHIGIVVSGSNTYYTTGAENVDNILIEDNTITGGFAGITFRGLNTSLVSNLMIVNNHILQSHNCGISGRQVSFPIIKNNNLEIGTSWSYSQGISLEYVFNGLVLSYNRIVNAGKTGLYFDNVNGSAEYYCMIYNNMIGGGYRSTSGYSQGINLNNSHFIAIIYNSINVDIGSGYAIYSQSNVSNLKILNNSFAYTGQHTGYAAYYTSPASLLENDYNNYYVGNSTRFIYYGEELIDLLPLQDDGHDLNSFISNPDYYDPTDLYAQSAFLYQRGTPVADIEDDYFGLLRHPETPCIGANEFDYNPVFPLSGNYVISQDGTGDFTCFSSALDNLMAGGISGTVIFNVQPGIYEEQILFDNGIWGSSEANIVTFRGHEDSRDAVILRYTPVDSEDRHVVRFTWTRHVKIENLTIEVLDTSSWGWPVHIMSGCKNIEISNCKIITHTNSPSVDYSGIVISGSRTNHTTGAYTIDDIKIENNTFNGGYAGITVHGTEISYATGINVQENEILNSYYQGIYVVRATNPILTGNNIVIRSSGSISNSSEGISLIHVNEGTEVAYNRIINAGARGIYLDDVNGSVDNLNMIYNNMIGGGYRTTAGNSRGINISNSQHIGLYYNSINLDSGSGAAFYSTSNVSNLRVINNSFTYSGLQNGYAAYYASPASLNECDRNNYYVGTSTNFIYYGEDIIDLLPLQNDGRDLNSFVSNPGYNSPIDLYAQSGFLYQKGIPIPGIEDDFYEEPRHSATPCIGANEFDFEPISPLSGNYVIDQYGSGDFPSFTDALYHLMSGGVTGPVIVNVSPGIYTEQINFDNGIWGSSEDNTITFRGPEDSRDEVVVRSAPFNSNNRYVLRMTWTRHIKLENLTIEALNTEGWGWGIHVMSGCQDIQIRNCHIITHDNSSSDNYCGIIVSDNPTNYIPGAAHVNNILIENSKVSGGFHGIYARGLSNNRISRLEILNNEIVNSYLNGIYGYDAIAPLMSQNSIDIRSVGTTTSNGSGIFLSNIYDGSELSYNVVTNPGRYGINLDSNVIGTVEAPNMIFNNMLGGGFRSLYSSGILLNNSQYINVFYNSINLNYGLDAAIRITNSATNLKLLNNSFAYSGNENGRAAYYAVQNNFLENDYNNYFVGNSTNFIYYETDISNLQPLQNHGFDLNSHVGNPRYLSPFDLHAQRTQLYQSGFSIPSIIDDIDGDARDTETPCIGADEFMPPDPPIVSYSFSDGYIYLVWEEVEGANSYIIYASEDPYLDIWGEPIAIVGEPGYSEEATETIRFYEVTSSWDFPPSVDRTSAKFSD